MIGAFALLAVNWALTRVLYRAPRLNKALEGSETVLIQGGVVDEEALQQEALSREELVNVLHRQSFDRLDEVERCVLEPGGTFYIEPKTPTAEERRDARLLAAMEALSAEVRELRGRLEAREGR